MYRQMEPRNYKTAEEAIQDIVNMYGPLVMFNMEKMFTNNHGFNLYVFHCQHVRPPCYV